MLITEPCPRPNGSKLDPQKQAVLKHLIEFFESQKFAWDPIRARRDEFVQLMNSTCSSDDDIKLWLTEIRLWVRWSNRYGYYLAYTLTDLTVLRRSGLHGHCLDLRADAQCSVAEDVALDSLEEAYYFVLQNRERLGDSFAALDEYYKRRLRLFHDYYYRHARPFGYIGSVPLTDHLYFLVTALFFESQFPEIQDSLHTNKLDGFDAVIDKCSTPDLLYYRVLGHRHLGIAHSQDQNFEEGAKQFLIALKLAQDIHLEPEIGHLQRLYGYNLRLLNSLDEAAEQFRQASVWESELGLSEYWLALSLRELAETLARDDLARHLRLNAKGFDLFIDSLSAGRRAFDHHLGMCAIPIARDAKQQIMRSFSENAIRYTVSLRLPEELLGEIEASGPREATDVALEIAAARRSTPETLGTYRRNRALYYRTLSTLSTDFDVYMENFEGRYLARHRYLYARWLLSTGFAMSTLSAATVSAVLDLKLPDVYLLLFHVGQFHSTAALIDLAGRHISIETFSSFTTSEVSDIHKKYIAEMNTNDSEPAATEGARKAALVNLLAKYEEFLAEYFRGIKPLLKGKHLKIFPRLEMNAVPFHALKIDGEYLVETCDISYGQTLGLFLENHSSQTELQQNALRMVMGDDVPWYGLLSSEIKQAYGTAYREEFQVSWPELMKSISIDPARDIVFACHGKFDPTDVESSYLQLAGGQDGRVSFSQVFEELDLRGCRSVMMGACESGVVQADISAEYIGLPSAVLSSGVRYVAGALWTIPRVSTAHLVGRYLDLLKDESNTVCASLCRAQREVLLMTRDDLSSWIAKVLANSQELENTLKQVAAMEFQPYAHPYFWAGLVVVGDV